jgi:aerobic-type carbon monoxide dehydrogenase small subunit (CoxS/CutS family)
MLLISPQTMWSIQEGFRLWMLWKGEYIMHKHVVVKESTSEFTIHCNGNVYNFHVSPDKPLLWVLRENLGLNGTKYGCGIGICGTCNVLLDGKLARSCMLSIESIGDKEVTTIEGLNDDLGNAIKDAWYAEKVSQCGYCQPGQIMSAYALLSSNPNPSDHDIDTFMRDLCRCGTYQRIRSAIKLVS